MNVQIHVATLVIEGKNTALTVKTAKQFPIRHHKERENLAEAGKPAPEPICKVYAKNLDPNTWREWLYLVEIDGDLWWCAPANFGAEWNDRVIAAGGWVDHPENVPTVILL